MDDEATKATDWDETKTWSVESRCVKAYQRDCEEGSPQSLDRYLPQAPPDVRRRVLIELARHDLTTQRKLGRNPGLKAYLDKYPELGSVDQAPIELVLEAYQLAKQHGEVEDVEEFCRDFPQLQETLRGLVQGEATLPQTKQNEPGISQPVVAYRPGNKVGDFEILEQLGQGSFATVYLARQVSLDRKVALKVSVNRGTEAQTLASLEHDYVVRVFSEYVDPVRSERVLCMQFISGPTLERIIAELTKLPPREWSGRAILRTLDSLRTHSTTFHPTALRDRAVLRDADHIQAACSICARLADALAYAHSEGVLHRDIKPANVLMTPYGRPLLADFNLAENPEKITDQEAMFGGSLAYMAPEHLDAFNSGDQTTKEAVDHRSDVYSFGTVLFELLTGRRPPMKLLSGAPPEEVLRDLARQRRERVPSPKEVLSAIPDAVDRIVRRCLDPEPRKRYQSAEQLEDALVGAQQLREIERELPQAGWLSRAARKRPFTLLVVLAFLPHLLATIVNISYNSLRIVSEMTTGQQQIFQRLVPLYNIVIYPICIWLVLRQVLPGFRVYRRLKNKDFVSNIELKTIRRRLIRWPEWFVAFAVIGWFFGGAFFPIALHLWSGPISAATFSHFATSFFISGVIALTYSYFAAQYICLSILYPQLFGDERSPRQTAQLELAGIANRLRVFQFLAAMIPLAAAAIMVGVGPEQFDMAAYRTFRVLVTALIAMGMAGLGLAFVATNFLVHTLVVLEGRRATRAPWIGDS